MTTDRESILVVEDDEGVALLEKRALERRGFKVFGAASADEAVTVVKDTVISLVVCDFRLPGDLTGLELYRFLRDEGFELPFILVTGFSSESTVIDAIRQGVRDFVPKSTEYLQYLPDAVERVLQAVRLERQLAESEARFHLFMDNNPAIAFIKDDGGRFLYANPSLHRLIGNGGILGKTDFDLWSKETASQLREHDLAAIQGGEEGAQFHETVTTLTGLRRNLLTYKFPLQDSSGQKMLAGMAVDLTQQMAAEEALRQREAELRQSQKMEAVGQLAGGVAHDFNNLLTVIIGYNELVRISVERGGTVDLQHLLEVSKAADKAVMLTKQLLAFSRRRAVEPKILNLNAVIKDCENMLRRLIGEDIVIQTVLEPVLQPILQDQGQVEQVLLNLVVNARDAMPEGGDLKVETANIELDDQFVASHPGVKPGAFVKLTVKDSGHGMDQATMARIFEPFFTTKEIGRGTGLGLATVSGIVKQSHGLVSVQSEVGRGTTFEVYFPIKLNGSESTQTAPQPQTHLRGSETILLVEDEEGVRGLCRHTLQAYGYHVLEAQNPLVAIRVSETHKGDIDLLITDVVMPQVSARQMVDVLRLRRSGMKVLYISGYNEEVISRQGIQLDKDRLLQKPFTPIALATRIREVLDSR